jgi:C-terminal processing protease CtpA/Prc
MKFQFRHLGLIGCFFFMTSAQAEEQCSALFFGDSSDANKVIDIIAIDGELVKQALHYNEQEARDIAKGEFPFYLAPGEHSLTLRVWDNKLFATVNMDTLGNNMDKGVHQAYLQNLRGETIKQGNVFKKNLKKLKDHYEEKTIQVRLLNNKRYLFGVTQDNNIATNIALLDTTTQKCEGDRKLLAETKEYASVSGLLPPRLETRLQSVISSLNSYHVKKGLANTNLVPQKVYEYFGTVLDTSRSVDDGYKVLAVLPYSLAHKLTISSGDIIIEFGGDSVSGEYKEANQELVKYISTVRYGKKIEFTVLRNNKKLTLSHLYITSIIPQSSYTFESVNNENQAVIFNSELMPEDLIFQYEHLMLELANFYKVVQGVNRDIEIHRSSTIPRKLGLTGFIKEKQDEHVFLVTNVVSNSAASNFGVQVDDLIHSINGQKVNSSKKSFESIASALMSDEQHNMVITRDKKKIRLQEKMQYPQIPSFSLKIAITTEGEFLKRKYWDRRDYTLGQNSSRKRNVNMHDNSSSGSDSRKTNTVKTTTTELDN